jgi:hypothetical protein
MLHLLLAKLFPWAVGVRWKAILNGAFYIGAFVLLVYCYLQHVALKQNQIIYRNPSIVRQIRTVRVEGPIRIVTRVVETPGRVERETVEERGPVSVVKESLTAQTPVFPPAQKTDRWLAGISANPFHYRESRSWGAYVGYGFRNRLDVMGGYSDGSPKAMIVLRF